MLQGRAREKEEENPKRTSIDDLGRRVLTYFPDEFEFSKHNFIYKLGFFSY